jgi:hypothetical protein
MFITENPRFQNRKMAALTSHVAEICPPLVSVIAAWQTFAAVNRQTKRPHL